MIRLLHRFLLQLPPERAHHLVVKMLKAYQQKGMSDGGSAAVIIGKKRPLRVRNRLGLAAGFDKNAEVYPAMAQLGFGFAEVGTVTPQPQDGNPPPRVWRLRPSALVNQLGFNNVGLEEFAHNLRIKRRLAGDMPVIANIGKNKITPNENAIDDYEKGAARLNTLVDGFVVNVSSPNTPGLRNLQTEEFLEQIAALDFGEKPVWIKLAPDLTNEEIKALSQYVDKNDRFDGIVLTNTSRQLAADAGFELGGLSGEPLFQRAVECVSIAREVIKEKTIVGVGGISTAAHARAMRNAGADLIEIYTGFIYEGPGVVPGLVAAAE